MNLLGCLLLAAASAPWQPLCPEAQAELLPIRVKAGSFDPLHEAEPTLPESLEARPDESLWIVQFHREARSLGQSVLRTHFGPPLRYLPECAGIWRLSAGQRELLPSFPSIRWVGRFHPGYKLEPVLLDQAWQGSLQTATYNLVRDEAHSGRLSALADAIHALGGRLRTAFPDRLRVVADLTPQTLIHLLHRDDLLFADRWGPPVMLMDNARRVTGVNDIAAQYGLRGSGVRGEILDGALQVNHLDWPAARPPLLHGSNGVFDNRHGTATYGICYSQGVSHANTLGLLPEGQGVFAAISTLQTKSRASHTAELLAAPFECVFQSNSWGSSPFGPDYTAFAQELDRIAFEQDLCIVQAQGNDGDNRSAPEAWAKNVISVGGIVHHNNADKLDDEWAGRASTGPAADDRIKPDLVGFMEAIWTSDAEPGGYQSGSHHNTAFGGTSGATPMVAGLLGLVYEMWHHGLFGNAVGATVFESRPRAALARALLIHSAASYPFSGRTHDLTRTHQGWGLPDLNALLQQRKQLYWVNESHVLEDGQRARYRVEVAPGQTSLAATMVYADPPPALSASKQRVNDLSLRVEDPGGRVYWGNHGLRGGNQSQTGGSPNDVDVVERVVVPNPAAGVWWIEVLADEVNQDGHLETAAIDADFALVLAPVVTAARIDWFELSGPAQVSAGAPLRLDWSGVPPNRPFWIYGSRRLDGSSIQGQPFDIGPGVRTIRKGTTATSGTGFWQLAAVPSKLSGWRLHLEMRVDAGGRSFDSTALSIDIQ